MHHHEKPVDPRSLGRPGASRVVFYYVSNVPRTRHGVDKIANDCWQFLGPWLKPSPHHASTPFCGVATMTLVFDQLEVPCYIRNRKKPHDFSSLTDAQTLLDSNTENVELPGVFVRGCSLRFPGFLCQNICDICGVIFCFRCFYHSGLSYIY